MRTTSIHCVAILGLAAGCTPLEGHAIDASADVTADARVDDGAALDGLEDVADSSHCPRAPSASAHVDRATVTLALGVDVHFRGAFQDRARRLYAYGATIDDARTRRGRAAVVRLLASGAIDPSFGTGGFVFIGPRDGSAYYDLSSMAQDARGRLFVAGDHTATAIGGERVGRGWITRLDDTGAVDRTFGDAGNAEIGGLPGGDTVINGIVIDESRIVVVGGDSNPNDPGTLGFIAALGHDGRRDATFAGGMTRFDFDAERCSAVRAVSGGYVVAASGRKGGARVLRFQDDGLPDPTFGDAGIAVHPAVPSLRVRAMTLRNDGSVLVAGADSSDRPAIARFDSLGRADMDFGIAGAYLSSATSWDVGYYLASILASECDESLVLALSSRVFRVSPSGRDNVYFEVPGEVPGFAMFGVVVDPVDGTITAIAGVGGHVTRTLGMWTVRP